MNGRPPPQSPDFRGAAGRQGDANRRAAQDQARLNNPNYSGPDGTQTVTIGPDGRPVVTRTLGAGQQGLYDLYTRNQGAAGDAARRFLESGRAGSELDTSSLGALPQNYEGTRQRVIDAMMARAHTAIGQEGDQLNSDLIARGLRPGTEAYERERDALGRKENDFRQQAELAGDSAATNALRGDLARRGQGFNELVTGRQIPMSEFATLMNGSRFQMPNMPGYNGNTQIAPDPTFAGETAQSNYDVDVWNAMNQQRNSNINGITGLAGSLWNTNPNSVGGRLIGSAGNSLLDWYQRNYGNTAGNVNWPTGDTSDWGDWML